jgi:hypothetical protein
MPPASAPPAHGGWWTFAWLHNLRRLRVREAGGWRTYELEDAARLFFPGLGEGVAKPWPRDAASPRYRLTY